MKIGAANVTFYYEVMKEISHGGQADSAPDVKIHRVKKPLYKKLTHDFLKKAIVKTIEIQQNSWAKIVVFLNVID